MPDSLHETCRRLQANDPTLTILNLNHLNIGNDGGRLLAKSWQTSTCPVRVAWLNQNQFQGSSEAWRQLCRVLLESSRSRLLYVTLNYNPHLANDGAVALAEQHAVLPWSRLHWTHNQLGDAGFCALVPVATQLQTFNVQHNHLGPNSLLFLVRTMQQISFALETLDVRYNLPNLQCCTCHEGEDCWWRAMAQHLETNNTTLEHVHVTHTTPIRTPCHVRVQLYTTLNQWGRRHFGQAGISLAAWTHVLARPYDQQLQTQPPMGQSQPPPPPSQQCSLVYALVRARPDLVTRDPMMTSTTRMQP